MPRTKDFAEVIRRQLAADPALAAAVEAESRKIWSVWEHVFDEDASCVSLVRGWEPTEQMRRAEPDAEMIFLFEADGYNDACRQRNELMGWEPYEPMLDANGDEYPEDDEP